MKIKCVSSCGEGLRPAELIAGNTKDSVFNITELNVYTVYGILFRSGVVYYLISNDFGAPQWTPASLFVVICDKPSMLWVWRFAGEPDDYSVLSFPEFARDPDAFESLILCVGASLQLFYKYKQDADLEFVDPDVKLIAEIVDVNWVKCPLCRDVWESIGGSGMVKCPKCSSVMRRPVATI